MGDSLLPSIDSQGELALPSSSTLPASFFEESETRQEWTGERLAKQRPETYRQIVGLLAEGLGVKRIAKILEVSIHTVQAVRDREPEPIATLKERVAADCRRVSGLCLESIREELLDGRRIAPRDAAWIAGVLIDKAELLSGSPTSRVRIEDGPSHLDVVDLFEQLRDRARMGLGREIGVTERDGLEVGPACAPGARVIAQGVEAEEPGERTAGNDSGQGQRKAGEASVEQPGPGDGRHGAGHPGASGEGGSDE